MTTKKAGKGASKTQSYREAAARLSRIADELESGETDLDRMLPLLSEAQAAYGICHERIEALRAVLGNAPAAPSSEDLAAELEDKEESATGQAT